MGSAELANLAKIGRLKAEPADQREFDALVAAARRHLADATVPGLSLEGRFLLAYEAAHSLGVAALRWHGFRSDNRYLVFQCLEHTVGMDAKDWRILATCHERRNLALYEGEFEIEDGLMLEMERVLQMMLARVAGKGKVGD